MALQQGREMYIEIKDSSDADHFIAGGQNIDFSVSISADDATTSSADKTKLGEPPWHDALAGTRTATFSGTFTALQNGAEKEMQKIWDSATRKRETTLTIPDFHTYNGDVLYTAVSTDTNIAGVIQYTITGVMSGEITVGDV